MQCIYACAQFLSIHVFELIQIC
uniref:Uncharacterized protein n=1 Tax=Rhizophora mucronata TaxID=61149 RepID=A0A2P2PKR1_RHIMU